MSERINNLSEEEIKEMGQSVVSLYCENCEYDAGMGVFSELVFKVSMQGGHYKYDGVGGCVTECPICKTDRLISEC